jgi:multiple sugar transport system substrate-binding protein
VVIAMFLTACGGQQAVTDEPPPPETETVTEAPPVETEPTEEQPPVEPSPTVPEPMAEPIVLNIMHNWGSDDAKGAPLQSIFQDFMAANPDVVIKDEVFLDSDIPLKVETAYAAGQEPDLVFVQRAGSVITWTDSGITAPVNDYLSEWGFDGKFKDAALSDFTQADGKIQAFPLEGFTWPIWYNTQILGEAGVEIPTTTAQLIEAAQKVRASGNTAPFVVGGADWTGMFFFQLVVESQLTYDEIWDVLGNGNWSNPNAIKGVELFVKLRDEGVFADGIEGLDFGTMNEKFFSGEAGSIHAGAWSFGEAPEELLPVITLGGFPLPEESPHEKPIIYSAFTAKGIWITRNGLEKIEPIQRFVQFIYQPEMIARFVEQAGMTPPLKEVPVDESALNPLFVQSLGLDVDIVPTQDLIVPPKVAPEFERITKEAYIPGTTVEQILADLTSAYEANE